MLGRKKTARGFALPTVLIASIVMIAVMLSAVQLTVSISKALRNQYYTKLADLAAEAGAAMARTCLAQNNNIPQWSDASPLRPNSTCSGDPSSGAAPGLQALVVAGGGGGGSNGGGGGGAGGVVYTTNYNVAAGNVITVTVGDGGAAGPATTGPGSSGANSVFGTITAIGGGGGASRDGGTAATTGGSGGGGSDYAARNIGAAGTAGQGFAGANGFLGGCNGTGGGGGGAGGVGAVGADNAAGAGGVGISNAITGTSVMYGGGGGGGPTCPPGVFAAGGNGGGGGGASLSNGTANTGGGGGGGGASSGTSGGNGGSGVVIVSYPTGTITATGGTVTTSGGNTIHRFTASGTFSVTSVSAPAGGCTIDPTCSVLVDGDIRTTFTVGAPPLNSAGEAKDFNVTGKTSLVRTSANTAWRTFSETYVNRTVKPYDDDGFPKGTSIQGYWSAPPAGYLLEDGAAVSRTTYADLFALIGTTYGAGDGSTTFNLPDSRGYATVMIGPSDPEFDTYGEKSGEKNHILTIPEMPSHTHPLIIGDVDDQNFTGFSSNAQYPPGDATGTVASNITTQAAGGGLGHNEVQPSIVKLSAIKYIGPPTGTISTLPAGTSIEGYWGASPNGYLTENGAAVSRSTYPNLYAAIGTTYGVGDGSTTFNVPDSRGRVTVNKNTADTEFDTMGEKFGTKTVTLTLNQIPAHSHGLIIGNTDDKNFAGGANQYPPSDAGGIYTPGQTTQATGGGGAHNNIQPSIVKMVAIKHTTLSSPNSSPIVGSSIQSWLGSTPSGYLPEDGAAVSRTTYANLFALLGTTFGAGDGSTTFNVPDSRGRVSVNKSDTDTDFDTIGELYGTKMQTLTVAQLPSHTHTLTVGVVDDKSFTGYTFNNQYPPADAGTQYTPGQKTKPSGGGEAHSNIQPSIVKMTYLKY
ncbi:MAG: hypothetical protein JWN33_547 [Candidatus Saccharibacteria bacterium]|nr:hypothetical protein [Candidatus Saccharibacteria bacterium]